MEEAMMPDGRTKKGVVIHRSDSVHVIAFDEKENVLLLREFRPFYQDYIWQLPGGKVDKENDIAMPVQRELQIEAGVKAASLDHYCSVNLSDSVDMTHHIFIARDLSADPLPQDEGELMEVHAMPIEEALEKVLTSTKIHVISGFALLRYMKENQ